MNRPPQPAPQPRAYTVEKVVFGGNGLVRQGGKVGFVPFTLPGEIIEATVEHQKKDFFNARLDRLTLASPDRVEPPCPYYARCGGCAYQHAAYPAQLRLKHTQVAETLARVGGFAELEVRPAIGSPRPYGYRNRITVHRRGGRIGFMARNRHHLIDIRECLLAQDSVNATLAELRRAPYEEGDVTLRAPETPTSFSQVNDFAVPHLLETIGALLNPAHGTLVDAYCGTGLYSRHFATRYTRVTGIEWSSAGIRRAREAAAAAHLRHLDFIPGDVAQHLPYVLQAVRPAETSVIINPPEVGVDPAVCDTLLEHHPAEIIYISCSPPTLARDLKRLAARYQVLSATPVDLFPQTAEVEVVAHLKLG
jgi:23S rRNA (uracil1939-C5)-methyltransferase